METSSKINELLAIADDYGRRAGFVIAGGGNVSVKAGEVLFVKASGCALAGMTEENLVAMDRAALVSTLQECRAIGDPGQREKQFLNLIYRARREPHHDRRPSVEVILHNLLPQTFVVHTHATVVNQLSCAVGGEELCREILGDSALWIPYVDPGCVLAAAVEDALIGYREKHKCEPRQIILQNHGLFVAGDSRAEIDEKTDEVIGKIAAKVGSVKPSLHGFAESKGPFEKLLDQEVFTSTGESSILRRMMGEKAEREAVFGLALTPDQIVYCGMRPVRLEEAEAEAVFYLAQNGTLPKVFLKEDGGIVGVGTTEKAARNAVEVFLDALLIMLGALRLGGIHSLNQRDAEFIRDWEIEQYRQTISN